MLKPLKSLRFRLILLVLIAVIPVLVISFSAGMEQRRLAREKAIEDAFRFTRLVSNYHAYLTQEARNLLQFISTEEQIRDPAACSQFLQQLHKTYTLYTSFSVADKNGNIYCSSATSIPPLNITDRAYFQEALKTRSFVIGETVIGRITGQTVLPFAIPFFQPNGEIQGVLIASLDLNQLLGYASGINLPTESAILIVDNKGTVITRYPETETWAGKNVPNVPIIQKILEGHGEGSAETQGVDGVNRLYAFTPMRSAANQQLSVSIGIPAAIAYADADRLIQVSLTWIGITSLLSLLVAWFGGDVLFLKVVSLTAERDQAEAKLREANTTLETRVLQRTEELGQANSQLQHELKERQRIVEILRDRESALEASHASLRHQQAELRELLQRVEQSNRDLQDFAYIASHDLQEPLRKIQAFSDRLGRRYAGSLGEEGEAFLERINSSASRMQAMINALLSYSRVNSKGQEFIPTNLNIVVQHVINDLELRLHETRGQIRVEDLHVVEADPMQMQHMFQNLIGNALKFHRPGISPLIKISDKMNDSSVIITVEDNGIGFDEKYLDKIFQPFQRLYSREEYEGNGIGLAVCRKIAERHHGTITATSVPGQGSCFVVTLPIKQTRKDQEIEA